MRLLTDLLRGESFRQVGACCAGAFFVVASLAAGCSQSSAPPPQETGDSSPSVPPGDGLPQMVAYDGYASSSACQSCHRQQHASWHKTFHRGMTQLPNVDSVLAPFNGEEISLGDLTCRMTRRDGEFFVEIREVKDAAPPPETRRIVMTTGSHHMQGYWLRRGEGNLLDQLPLVWLLEEDGNGRWVPRQECFLHAPSEPPPSSQLWNTNCISCHSVNGVPGIDRRGSSTETRVAELGIACEACHGPGQAHIAAYQDVSRERRKAGETAIAAGIVNPRRLQPDRSAQVCGQCHAVTQFANLRLREDWFLFGNPYRPGDDLNETRLTALPSSMPGEELNSFFKRGFIESNFWSDGMVRVGGREYNGLLESACYQRGGMTCLDCHSMHDSDPNDMLGAGMDTNEACYRCHSSYRQELELHSHHLANSSGSLCYNCHMPHTSYSLLKGMRSHQISSPEIALTLGTGRPNACNLCHLDQTLAWSAEKLAEWYGQKPAHLDEDQQSISAAILWMLRGDAVQRVLLAWSCGWSPARHASGEEWLPPFLAQLLEDPYSAVRLGAGRSLKKLGYDLTYDYLAPQEARSAARRETLGRWQRRAADANREFPARLLLNQERCLREDEVERLIGTRDDRPLRIAE
jgi:predicted CXXCH cytochrome family protein